MESQNMGDNEEVAGNIPPASVVEDVSESKDETSSVSSGPRMRCKYGASCYRRNEDHKKQFSHPDDPDHAPATSDDRPECKYGTLCYRRNPQHRIDFKHNSTPAKKRKAKVKKEVASDQESSDDYDYDDPFLNDGSSDDYQPTSSSDNDSSSSDGEDTEENLKRTLREGKKFVKH
ncbi:aprataxin and PNK-like factor [Hetaerina americana]|uniref:aprataxin and PNK-like factor n=1 Tax=Hetaerina americana TaxID=62018 RepID=UPI003A7F5A76